ncbi:hypothetical protein NDU88_005138 [Pleurodeles waltl]|uniref:Uncharacterized protein n=1 Tax=Pleurodeles waltl TaxID=8319 RepID=A0AAV7V506_PLEWA|nr:hypothetical protein NDU88_005138 [Pleurodeles waltl]
MLSATEERGRRAPQGEKSGSDEGDPGEPFAGSAPWDEEKGGPSAAGWIGPRSSGFSWRAKAAVQRRQPRLGVVPSKVMVRKGECPGPCATGGASGGLKATALFGGAAGGPYKEGPVRDRGWGQ